MVRAVSIGVCLQLFLSILSCWPIKMDHNLHEPRFGEGHGEYLDRTGFLIFLDVK